MFKGFTQLGLLAGALVTTALLEAALPIWMADQVSSADHKMSSAEYGSLQAWQACASSSSQASCTDKLAALQDDTLEIKDMWVDNGRYCGHQPDTARTFAGTLQNTSGDVVITSAFWSTKIYQNGKTHNGSGNSTGAWVKPGESKTTCLLTIDFETAENANLFDASGVMPRASIHSQRGLKGRS